jgi:gamma-glutamyltranspeptidase/glutathione hydrolase
MHARIASTAALTAALVAGGLAAAPTTAGAANPPPKTPIAIGHGGAVATVDADATSVGIGILRRGGNAVDAAVATAAALGVTEPYSAGIGGGGFLVIYDARSGKVTTIDGRETAPAAFREDSFIDPDTARPIPFAEAVTSGLGVGVPGTVRQWEQALERFGTMPLRQLVRPAVRLAESGFVVDQTFRDQTIANQSRFSAFTSTSDLFLPGGAPPAVDSTFHNPDLARTYRRIAQRGADAFYAGPLARAIVDTVQDPPVAPDATIRVRPGLMQLRDLSAYRAINRRPTKIGYRGLDVYGMAPPSSGGSTVGEALNILERFDVADMSSTQALHHYLEASRLSFADRNRYVGDPAYVDVPLRELLSDGFATERACLIDPAGVLAHPAAPGSPDGEYAGCPAGGGTSAHDHEGVSTTHLTVADRWGNVVSYTFTIEQTGGSGIVVPGYGFLLNNELTDFNFGPPTAGVPDPNLPAPGKRPRSSMSPTIVLRGGRPVLALGSPGGSTIITTVLQVLVNRIDLGMSLLDAVAAPRATQRNTATTLGEPAFLALPEREQLEALGHSFAGTPEIGAATAIEFFGGGRLRAVAEPSRRGGGSAAVVRPSR